MEVGAAVWVTVDETFLGPSSANEVGLDEVVVDEDVIADFRVLDDMAIDEDVDVELDNEDDVDDDDSERDVMKELCADTEVDQPRGQ